jgi:hypothetical protein
MLREGEIEDLPRAVALDAAAGAIDPHDARTLRTGTDERRPCPRRLASSDATGLNRRASHPTRPERAQPALGLPAGRC